MDDALKQRLVGAAVIISLGIIFIPMLLDGGRHTDFEKIRIEIPVSPDDHFSSSIQPLDVPRMMTEPAPEEAPIPEITGEPDAPPAVVDAEVAKILEPTPVTQVPEASETVKEQAVPQSQPVIEDNKTVKAVTPVPDKPAIQESTQADQTVAKITSTGTGSAIKSIRTDGPKAWVVQVGSFDSRENAVLLQNKLRKQGFPGFVESFMKDGELSHRVRIGPEIYRADAEKILSQLKDKMSLTGIVVSYP